MLRSRVGHSIYTSFLLLVSPELDFALTTNPLIRKDTPCFLKGIQTKAFHWLCCIIGIDSPLTWCEHLSRTTRVKAFSSFHS